MNEIIEFLRDLNRIVLELIPLIAFAIGSIGLYKLLKK